MNGPFRLALVVYPLAVYRLATRDKRVAWRYAGCKTREYRNCFLVNEATGKLDGMKR